VPQGKCRDDSVGVLADQGIIIAFSRCRAFVILVRWITKARKGESWGAILSELCRELGC
jgi:hypothetical protein